MSNPNHWIPIGKVARPRGLKGEFFLDMPLGKTLGPGTTIRVGTRDFRLVRQWESDRTILLLEGVGRPEDVEALRNQEVSVPREALGEGLLLSDLIGCQVIDAKTGQSIGTVKAWHENPGHDLIELDNGALIPLVDQFFPVIDPTSGRLEAHLPEGLLDL